MHRLIRIGLLLLCAATPAGAVEIRSTEECAAAVAADPAAAREAAAIWERMDGGIAPRLCEAEALAAMGAHATAALLLTRLAENPNRAMGADLRAVVLGDGAGQWLEADRPDLAQAALAQADRIAPPDRDRRILQARAAAALDDWPAAQAALDAQLAVTPNDPLALALLAATLRHQGDLAGAERAAEEALRLDPEAPEAVFEAAAAAAETGDPARASELWLRLIRTHPDNPLAESARANLQRLN